MTTIPRLYIAVAHCVGNKENFWLSFKLKKLAFSLLLRYDATKAAKKRLLKLTKHSKLSMITKIDVDDLKI